MDRSRVEAVLDNEVNLWIWDRLFIIAKGIDKNAEYIDDVVYTTNGINCYVYDADCDVNNALSGIPIDALYDPEAYIEEYLSEEH